MESFDSMNLRFPFPRTKKLKKEEQAVAVSLFLNQNTKQRHQKHHIAWKKNGKRTLND